MLSTDKNYQELLDENNFLRKQLKEIENNHPNSLDNIPNEIAGSNSNLFKIVFENADIGLAILDADGKFKECNHRFSEITGYSHEELRKIDFTQITYPDDLALDMKYIPDVLAGKINSFSIEKRYIHKRGNLIWINLLSNVTRDKNGNIELVIAAIEDITEKKKLKQVEDIISNYNTRFDSMSIDEIMEAGLEEAKKITDSKIAFFHFVNEKTKEIILKKWSKNTHKFYEFSREAENCSFSKAGIWVDCISKKKPVIHNNYPLVEHEKSLPNRHLSVGRELIAPVIEMGKVVAIIGVGNKKVEYTELDAKIINNLINSIWEVVRQKRIEEKLLESERNFRTFFNAIDEFLFVLDKGGYIIEANTTAINRLEFSRNDLIGRSVLMVHPETLHNEASNIINTMLNDGGFNHSIPLQTVHKVLIPTDTRISKGKWNNKDVFFVVSKDLSKWQYSEEKFSKVFHINPAICAIIDLYTDTFHDVNDTFFQKLKFNREQVFKENATVLLKMNEQLKTEMFQELKKTGSINNTEIMLPTSENNEIPALLSGETVILSGKKYFYAIAIDISDKIETEQRIKKSESELREAQNIAQIGHYTLDIKTGIWESSESLNVIFGIDDNYTRNVELWLKIVEPSYKEEMLIYFQDYVLKKHNEFDKEYKIVCIKDKIEKWVHGRGGLKFNDANEPVEMIGTIQEITSRKNAKLKLEQSEKKFRALFENMSDAFALHKIILDKKGQAIDYIFIDVNPVFEQRAGMKKKELINRSVLEIFPNTEKFWINRFGEVALSGKPIYFTDYSVELDRYFEARAYCPIPEYFAVVFKDVTTERKTRQKLAHNEKLFKDAGKLGRIGSWEYDISKGIFNVSEELLNIYGFEKKGKDISLFKLVRRVDKSDFNKAKKFIKSAFNGDINPAIECKIVLDRNIEKFVHIEASYEDVDNVKRIFGFIQDITEKKLNELKVQKSENAFKLIIQSTMGKGGQAFFDAMTHSLNQITNADFTFIGEYIDNNSVRTLSLCQKGEMLDNFIYNLKDTPCGSLVSGQSCVYTEKITELFPNDCVLIDKEVEAFAGTPVFDHLGKGIGVIVSLYQKPISDAFFIQSVCEICSSSIGSEMERSKTELRVQENEQTLNTIFDNAPVIMMLLDDKGEIIIINKIGLNLKDYSSEILTGRRPGDILNCIRHLGSLNGCGTTDFCSNCVVRNTFYYTLETGEQSYKRETEFTSIQNGKEFQHTFLVSSSRIEQEGKYQVLITLDDITERKMMEQKIHENELSLNKIFDHAPVIMMLINEKLELIRVNKSGWGGKPGVIDVIGKHSCKDVLNCIGLKSGDAINMESELCLNCIILQTIRSTIQTGEDVYKKEADIISIKHSEISLKTYLISSSLIEKGKSKEVLLTLDDITKRKKMEEELMFSKEKSVYNEKRYRLLSNLTFEGIILHQNERIIDVNKALSKMSGYSYSELIGQDSKAFLFPPEYKSLFDEKHNEEYSAPYETVIIQKNGSRFPVEIESRYLMQNSQRIRVSAIRDITERKLGEKKILQAVMQTEENERARFAQELHDGLGPILSNVQMYFQWLAEEDDNKQFVVDKGNLSLKSAFSTLREISNNLSPHILHNFGLSHAINNFIDSIVTKNIRFDFKTTIESCRFNSNIEISIYRVITELINNSLKYSAASKIKLEMHFSDNLLSVMYTDNGKGFDLKEMEKTSTGFGMININNRIKSVQGQIKVKSNINEGVLVEIKVAIK